MMTKMKSALLAATLLVGGGGIALAQGASTYDPAQLPVVKGKVAQYTLTPRGDVDGLILADGTEVHTNPRLSTQLVFAVKPGDAVTIHGLKARAEPMVAAASVTNDATGATVSGGGERRGWGAAMEASGTVKEVLHTPHGDANGVLLSDGTVVRLPPPDATRLAADLAVGKPLYVQGNGIASPLGRVVMARQIGPDKSKLTEIRGPHPRFGWMHEGMARMGGMMHGGMMGDDGMGGGMMGHRPPSN
ncbi:MAG: hypothetical protein KGQ40_14945 [Rhodospirillales bacterium]|nr:hypothetical protein [Rhodospirillales bacterium]